MSNNIATTDIVYAEAARALTNSILVAQKFGKDHKNVMQAIQNLIGVSAENSAETNNQQLNEMFTLAEYDVELNNGTGATRKAPMYVMNRDGFSLLVMGFTGKQALKFKLDFINAFNKMEEMLQHRSLPQTYADALRQLADTVEQKEKIQLQLQAKTEQLDESMEWFSIKRWAKLHHKNWRSYKWRVLKALSSELGYEVKRIFDGNYDEVNIYHRAVFEAAYGK